MTKFGMWMQILTQAMEMWENFRNSQIQDGGRTPYWKSFFGYITQLNIVRLRRNLEFGGLIACIQRFGDENVKFPKSTWRTAAILKIVIAPYISGANRPNLTKSGTQTQILSKATETWQKFRNSQIQDSRQTPYWKSFFCYNSAPSYPIKTEFGVRRHNRAHTKVRWWKCPILKIHMADK